jgi:hypothetical protein
MLQHFPRVTLPGVPVTAGALDPAFGIVLNPEAAPGRRRSGLRSNNGAHAAQSEEVAMRIATYVRFERLRDRYVLTYRS